MTVTRTFIDSGTDGDARIDGSVLANGPEGTASHDRDPLHGATRTTASAFRSSRPAASAYLKRGWRVVPIPPRMKCPVLTDWQHLRLEEHELDAHFGDDTNIGLLLGEPSGGLVDVDCDCAEARELAEKLLPPTAAVTGRTGNPRSHRWYIARGTATRQFKDPITRAMIVELRSTGVQTVVGPSVHPEGDRYDMLVAEPAVVDADELLRAVEQIHREVLIARYGHVPEPPRRPSPGLGSVAKVPRVETSPFDLPKLERRAIAYLAKMRPAVSGQGGHDATYAAATVLVHGFGLPPKTALSILEQHYNPRCEPPWSVKELEHKVNHAETKPHDLPYGWLRDQERPKLSASSSTSSTSPSLVPSADAVTSVPGQRPFTDLGNAERLLDRHGGMLMHCSQTGKWLAWNGRRWSDEDQGTPRYLMGQTARSILKEAMTIQDPDRRRASSKWATSSESKNRIEAGVALAATLPQFAVTPAELDADRWLLNVANGTIDLRTGRLRDHDPDDRITRIAPVEYDPKAACPQFLAFLHRIFGGDQALIDFVQRLLGMCLTGDVSEQYLFIFHGVGANGKSVLIDLVMRLLGPYAGLATSTLLEDTGRSEHPTETADLMGRRLVVASETEDGAELKLQAVKRYTGDAELKGRFMHQDYFTFPRTHKLVMVTNNKPKVREESEAVWRRLRLVPFSVVIPPGERDTNLPARLWEERAGVLAWLVEGCRCWQEVGLGEPPAILAATASYRSAEDIVGRFLAERCHVDVEDALIFEPWSSLYATFESWAEGEGEIVLTAKQLRDALDKRGIVSQTRWTGGKAAKVRMGVRLGPKPGSQPIE